MLHGYLYLHMSTVPPSAPDSGDLTSEVRGLSLSQDTVSEGDSEQDVIVSLATTSVKKELSNISRSFGVDIPEIAKWAGRRVREIIEMTVSSLVSSAKNDLAIAGFETGKAPAARIKRIIDESAPKSLEWLRKIVEEKHH